MMHVEGLRSALGQVLEDHGRRPDLVQYISRHAREVFPDLQEQYMQVVQYVGNMKLLDGGNAKVCVS